MKTALLIGPDFFGYNESIGKALEAAGYRVRIVTSPTHTPGGLFNRLTIDGGHILGTDYFRDRWRRRFNDRLRRLAADLRPDLVLVVKGDWTEPETLRQMPGHKAIWFQDAARRCGPDHLALAAMAQAVFVFELSDLDYLATHGIAAQFLPMGFDPDIYRPLETARSVDLAFVGRLYPNRRELLQDLIRQCPDLKVEVWGRYVRYKEPGTWWQWLRYRFPPFSGKFMNRNVPPTKVNAIYNRARLVLNIHHLQSRHGCNPRAFEICASGSLQLCDENRYAAETLGAGIVQFQDLADLKSKVRRYLDSSESRQQVADLGHQRAADHTFAARIEALLASLGSAPSV